MSNFKEMEMREKLIQDLMCIVRKNAMHSACLDAFESLLSEVKDFQVVKTVIADMNKSVEEFMLIFKEIDKLSSNSVKARILTYEFIRPERFFSNTTKKINQYIYLNAAINAKFYYNQENRGAHKWDIGNINRLGSVWKTQYYKIGDPSVDVMIKKFNMENMTVDDPMISEMQEECRKVILLWNYCPAIFKAILQTKRRSLGLDTNSQKF